jgi:hypothetical protein
MNEPQKDRIDELFADGKEIDRAMRESVREALILHKKLGLPIAEWRDGKVVWTPPEEIDVDEPPNS